MKVQQYWSSDPLNMKRIINNSLKFMLELLKLKERNAGENVEQQEILFIASGN